VKGIRRTQADAHLVQGNENHMGRNEVACENRVEEYFGNRTAVLRKDVAGQGCGRNRADDGSEADFHRVDEALAELHGDPGVFEVFHVERFGEAPGVVGIFELCFENEHPGKDKGEDNEESGGYEKQASDNLRGPVSEPGSLDLIHPTPPLCSMKKARW
jgi:hypothetical protein